MMRTIHKSRVTTHGHKDLRSLGVEENCSGQAKMIHEFAQVIQELLNQDDSNMVSWLYLKILLVDLGDIKEVNTTIVLYSNELETDSSICACNAEASL
ncbi:hypothetical protein M8J77_005688 [Diaphorina citri]|nr:hypothetical protein M8J77_005688 [Diaphorina citri]